MGVSELDFGLPLWYVYGMRSKGQRVTCNAVYKIGYHLVWCTKRRRKWLVPHWSEKMREVIRKVAAGHRLDLQQLEVMPDHVHCFVGAPSVVSPSNIARILKGASSCIFLRENPEFRSGMRGSEHLWNPSYYVGSVGDMSKSVVLRYIESQRQDV